MVEVGTISLQCVLRFIDTQETVLRKLSLLLRIVSSDCIIKQRRAVNKYDVVRRSSTHCMDEV